MYGVTRFLLTCIAGISVLIAQTAAADIMVLGGNPPGSIYYPVAQGLASTVEKYTDTRVDVLPQSGTVFVPMFMTGEVDMGIVNPIEAKLATQAMTPFDGANDGKGYPMWTVMQGSPIRVALVTSKDTGIETLSDLKGKRVVANYGAYVGASISVRSALENGGLTLDDVDVVSVSSYPEGVRAVMEGRADAAIGSIGSGIIQELEAARGAHFIGVDPSEEPMRRTRAVSPAWFSVLVPKGGSPGIEEDTNVLAYNMTIMARYDIDDELVKQFIDTIWNHNEELVGIHRLLGSWTIDRFASPLATIAYHPAAVEYYKAKGVWTDEMEKHQQMLLELQPD